MHRVKLECVSEDNSDMLAERVRESERMDEQARKIAKLERMKASIRNQEENKNAHALEALLAALALMVLLIVMHYEGLFPPPGTYRMALAVFTAGATLACLVLEIKRARYYGRRAAETKVEHDQLDASS